MQPKTLYSLASDKLKKPSFSSDAVFCTIFDVTANEKSEIVGISVSHLQLNGSNTKEPGSTLRLPTFPERTLSWRISCTSRLESTSSDKERPFSAVALSTWRFILATKSFPSLKRQIKVKIVVKDAHALFQIINQYSSKAWNLDENGFKIVANGIGQVVVLQTSVFRYHEVITQVDNFHRDIVSQTWRFRGGCNIAFLYKTCKSKKVFD